MDRDQLSRRRFLRLAAVSGAAAILGAAAPFAPPRAQLPPWATARKRTLYRRVAIADGRSSVRRRSMSILVADGRIAWIRPADSEADPGPASGLVLVDGAGLTVVPGMVDAHTHVVVAAGPNYLAALDDPTDDLLAVAERNGLASYRAGVRWLRDVGSPIRTDPLDGRRRGLALGVRDRWVGKANRPTLRAAGGWLALPGLIPHGGAVEVRTLAQLRAAALRQVADGADLVKLYLQRSGAGSPWTPAEVKSVVDAVHAKGRPVTAHTRDVPGARAAVWGGVDAVEHGYLLDAEVVARMAKQGTVLVTTLSVPLNFLRLGETTRGTYYASAAGKRYAAQLLRDAQFSARLAHRAGVKIAAGTDLGGGSVPAGQLAGEVEALVGAGLEPWQALGSATWRGGELLDEPDAGVIREGGPASFVLVRGDPYSDPAALRRIVPG